MWNVLHSTSLPFSESFSLSLKSIVTVSERCCAGISTPNCCGLRLQLTPCGPEEHSEAKYLHIRISRCRKKLSSRMGVERGRRCGTVKVFSFGPELTVSLRKSSFGATATSALVGSSCCQL